MNTHKTTKKGLFVTDDGQNVLFTFLLLILLFALWGFCNGMVDVMDKHFQEVLHLDLAQSAWVQFAHYLGYFLMALPAGWLATKLGYKGGIIAGLLLVAVSGFLVYPGDAHRIFLGIFAGRLHHCSRPHFPRNYRKSIRHAAVQNSPDFLKHWLNSLTEIRTTGAVAFSNKGASNLVSVGLLLFLGGRFIGTALLRQFAAHKLLGLYGAINTVLCLLIFCKLGWLSGACVLLTYFFMSIMFPPIFALGIFGLGQRAKKASSFLVMAIMGGAILPKVMGAIADMSDLSRGFIVPMLCFAFIAVYAFMWPRLSGSEGVHGVSSTGGH